MDEPTKEYLKGFNSGYLLSKHEPELLNTLIRSLNNTDSEYARALQAGKKQHDRELLLQQIRQSQELNRSKGKEKGI